MDFMRLEPAERRKVALLSSWFFVTVATLWIIKSVRVAALVVYLGARETPYVRLGSVAAVAVVVLVYSYVVNRLTRVQLVRATSLSFAVAFIVFWVAGTFGGAQLANQRPFIWAIYMLADVYAVVMIELFWTYANDVVTESEAKRIYGLVGLGGILGGIAGGAFVDVLTRTLGAMNLLLVAAVLVVGCAAIGSLTERVLAPPPRKPPEHASAASAFDGISEVGKSRYLVLLISVVVAYEITATLCDYGVNVLFEHAHYSETELTRLYGRLGWVSSATAVVVQVALAPLVLPSRRTSLLLPPLALLASIVGVVVLPVVATAFVMATVDRGLNYSIQQATRESLYVPLSDVQKYKAKAFIDMFVDRAAKALGSIALLVLIAITGESVRGALLLSFGSMWIWIGAASRLGGYRTRASGLPERAIVRSSR
jgi:AAA family ATP:ADP antiporter